MKKKLLSLLLVLILAFSALPISAFAADLPKGFLPYLEAWQKAKETGNEDEILTKGTAYLDFLAQYELNDAIANNQYNVTLDRLERAIYENRSDWDGAIANTKALLSASEYLTSIGVDRQDMITRCKAHLKVLEPFIGVYAASYTQSNTFGSKYAPASATLSYLATLKSPVLLRVGGEMDLWADPEQYKASFRHVAVLADSIAPNVELVWSPNCSSSWGVNASDFYPGDDVVDWVGMSLYYNYVPQFPNSFSWANEYFGFEKFADSIRNADNVMKIAIEHNKPAIATEGGAHHGNGEAYVAEKAAKEYSMLTMVYPQIKAMIYFDTVQEADYTLVGNNYFKLRDLGTALNFDVDYDAATKTMIIQSK